MVDQKGTAGAPIEQGDFPAVALVGFNRFYIEAYGRFPLNTLHDFLLNS
jgi:hypothetical protein